MEVSGELALLALDIAERGVRQPTPITQESAVVSGHRRLAAARLAGIGEVPCVVQDDEDDADMAVEMTLNNAPRRRPFTQLMAHALVLKEIVEPILAARKRHQDPSGLPGYASIAPIRDDGGGLCDKWHTARSSAVGGCRWQAHRHERA